jgi:hypothetical protein
VPKITTFTWGYWGWGTHAADFVRAADFIEHRRGYRPPIFADIRFSRSVRAPGFSGGAFGKTVGTNRYRWMKSLGNANIGTGKRGARIADPAGIEELLKLIIDADKDLRRVIVICACPRPCKCHRAIVARMLCRTGRRKRVPLTVVEWPGAEPKAIRLVVSTTIINNVPARQ